jgi:DNA polymerase delta subunit 2
MPGSQDFSTAYLPQQPINSFMFRKLVQSETINLVTNPHRFELAGLGCVGVSGQQIHDMQMYSRMQDPSGLNCLRTLMELRHLCPTAPDTLRSFPFSKEDPFVISQPADVVFTGCMPEYQASLEFQDETKFKRTALKLICVPAFLKTRSVVLLDTFSLESYELKMHN